MSTPTDVANLALAEIGQRIQIASFSDGSPAANVAALFYTPKTQMLLRAANWDFARAQVVLTQWKAVLINGTLSSTPPPQPWQFSYLYPSDALKIRFVMPTVNITASFSVALTSSQAQYFPYPGMPTAVPFVSATDFDANGNPIRVILSNVPNAQAVYTRDLSQIPDAWDPLFLSADTALLGSYFINALARDKAQMEQQIGITKNILDQARAANANEGITSVDRPANFIQARKVGIGSWWLGSPFAGVGYGFLGAWDSCTFPNGLSY